MSPTFDSGRPAHIRRERFTTRHPVANFLALSHGPSWWPVLDRLERPREPSPGQWIGPRSRR
jgi:hypothetical protein